MFDYDDVTAQTKHQIFTNFKALSSKKHNYETELNNQEIMQLLELEYKINRNILIRIILRGIMQSKTKKRIPIKLSRSLRNSHKQVRRKLM